MSKKFSKKPIALALGAAFALSGAAAQASVFQLADLGAGYMVASAGEGKTGEQKCGEGKCGAACLKTHKDKGKSEADAKAMCDKAKAEGKCGEGKCGADKDKKKAEGKCGGKK